MRTKLLGRILLAAALAFALTARAQDYPANAIKIIVPSGPGATTDALARLVADQLQKKWGQPVIVDNRAGAAGNIGAEYVIRANPDGYTLLFSYPAPIVVNKSLYAKLPYDPDMFEPVAMIGSAALVLAVNPKVAANSARELIALAKANPNRLNFASQGNGTTGHLAGELFNSMAGVRIVHVPYRSSAPAQTALLSGQVEMMLVELSSVLQHIAAGRLRALAVGSAKRSAALPDVPAMSEVLPGFVSLTWFGMVAPPKTPSAIVKKLSAGVGEALRQPDVATRLRALTIEAMGGTPEDMALFLKQERERWGGVIRSANVKTQ